MKKSHKHDSPTRRLRLSREVIVELKSRQLAEVAGGLGLQANGAAESTNPRCDVSQSGEA